MARNEEKQMGRLNRMILEREKAEKERINPKRPRLSTLNSVDEIKKWLPGIKTEIDFNLKQSQVTCYSDDKVAELHEEVVRLEKEYKNFVRKIKQLDSSILHVPWTKRPYMKRGRPSDEEHGVDDSTNAARIRTPILDEEKSPSPEPVVWNCDSANEDLPLQFAMEFNPPEVKKISKPRALPEYQCKSDNFAKLAKLFNIDKELLEQPPQEARNTKNYFDPVSLTVETSNSALERPGSVSKQRVWSGIDYSSSSDED